MVLQEDLRYLEADEDLDEDFLGGGGEVVSAAGLRHFPRLWCSEGQYSAGGQLFMVPLSQALRLVMHLGEPLPAGRCAGSLAWARVCVCVYCGLND